jgi:hypothetical protein
MLGGNFNGGAGNDVVGSARGGTFNGGPGTDACPEEPPICNLGPQP